ncbi:MAG TPA: DUF2807 domain-containing protein [Bacteroidia bacterium]|nr:DUF2807 domain-containing protein [Bacteroidia bacterium]
MKIISRNLNLCILSILFFFSGRIIAQFHETREFKAFNSVEVLGSVSVHFTFSDTGSIIVYAEEKELAQVETEVKNGKLVISNRGGKFTEPVKVYLKHNQLNAIECSGASSFKSSNAIKTDSLSVSLSGSSNVKIKTECRNIRSIESGASQLNLSGSASALFAELSGASSLSAYDLITETVKVNTTGASNAKVYSNLKVTAIAGGASSIKIKGDVKDVSAEASPSSSITRIVEKSSASAGDNEDSTVYNWKGRKIIIIDKEEDQGNNEDFDVEVDDYFNGYRHWAGFSFGVNGYVDPARQIEIAGPYSYMNIDYSKSFNYQFNLFENQFHLIKQKLVLVTGFGFDYHSYQLEQKVKLLADEKGLYGQIDTTGEFNYKKNRLRNTYIQVPLLLEFNGNGKSSKCFHIAAGVIGQYQILSRTRQLLERDSYEYDIQRKAPYNTNPFMLKAHVNLGYSRWTFFGEYALTPLFQKNKGPELYPFSVGLRIVPFG